MDKDEDKGARLAALLLLMKYAGDEAAEMALAELEAILDRACDVIGDLLHPAPPPPLRPAIRLVAAHGDRKDLGAR